MAGATPELFRDWFLATGPQYLAAPSDIANIAQKHRNYVWSDCLKGAENAHYIQGGSKIKDNAIFRGNGSTRSYDWGEHMAYENKSVLQQFEVPWAFKRSHFGWNMGEIETNDAAQHASGSKLLHIFASVKEPKETAMIVDFFDHLEDTAWAQPTASMEATGSVSHRPPYSIPFFINEFANGLWGAGNAQSPGITTREQLDPTNFDVTGSNFDSAGNEQSNWKCQTEGYSAIGPSGDLLVSMDKLVMQLGWEAPSTYAQYYDTPRLSRLKCLASLAGVTNYKNEVRVHQDLWVTTGRKDSAVPDPTNNGIPIQYCDSLNTAALYNTNTANGFSNEAAADDAGPRYYYWNGNDLRPVLHERVFMRRQGVYNPGNQPDQYGVPYFSWFNWIDRNARNHGIVYPTADIS